MDSETAHAMIRFGFGTAPDQPPPADAKAWLHAQLKDPDPALADPSFAGLPGGASALAARRDDFRERKRILAEGKPLKGNFKPRSRAIFLREAKTQLDWTVSTSAPFRERLVWFWANHFTTSIRQGGIQPLVGAFMREAIRPHVTGKFTDMVLAAERHPAMLLYLSNAFSVGPDSQVGLHTRRGLNENLGRECMELHTVSLRAHYTQVDVTSMAKLLTGWSINPAKQPTGFMFRPFAHEPGPQTVLGRRFPPGEQGGFDALKFLSTHPSTWQSLATKLARHFCSDNPPQSAVDKLTSVLADTQGDLGTTSAALVDMPEAWTPLTKVKTPFDYVISLLRASSMTTMPAGFYLGSLRKLGQPLWAAPLPNGWSDYGADWTGSDAVLARIDFGYTIAARNHRAAPMDIAQAALGPLLRPATATAIGTAGSPREALAMLFSAPEFQRR
ncbi:DUF1800 domain-containing protein [Acidiphilium iwatense]|uniref:DUF1800 domain-containing protein n=1 Tax=Acidiphilium iwatense TaxID=768198 RepID=A0ABS9DS38_9PROT|nr:DUF1800 domain-containing protein [Acidiphilium iwatense]MCF3945527.1 DUF1800 domain-containing protein [Acidiphilium iwatense]